MFGDGYQGINGMIGGGAYTPVPLPFEFHGSLEYAQVLVLRR